MKLLIIILLSLIVFGAISFYEVIDRKTSEKIQLGVWTEGLYDASKQKLNPQKLLEFEKLTDKKYSIAHYYRGWESFIDPVLISEFESLNKEKWQPMLNANPYYFKDCPAQDMPIYEAIATGKCDDFLRRAGKNLSKVDKPFYLLFAWEMNNKDLEWSVPYTQSTSSDFRLAWQRMHKIFQEEKVDSIVWVFCPNIPDVAEAPYKDLYPGDEYVDWVCLDGYNWGTTQSWSAWYSFKDVYNGPYQTLTSIAPNKPVMIGEINTTDQGGNKAEWLSDMFRQIPTDFPKVKAVVIFNEDRTKTKEKINWKIDVNPASLEAFRSGVNLPEYK